jgi:PAS domain S-box-containing protein
MKNYLRYACAILAVPAAVLLRFALLPLIGHGAPYITLFPVTVIVAVLAGMGPAILTGVLSAIAIDYFIISPLYAIEFNTEGISRMTVMILTSIFVGYVGNMLRKAKEGLEIRVVERTAELQKTNESLRLEESRLDALLRLSQMSEIALDEITGFTLEQAIKLTHSEIGFVGFLSEDEQVYTLHSVSKDVVKECNVAGNPIHWPVTDAGIWADAIRERRTLFVNDYSKPHPRKKGIPAGHIPIKRLMVVPLLEGGKIVTVAGVGNKESDYNKSDERQVSLLLSGMWSSVQKSRSREELQKAYGELEERVKERTAELAAFAAALQESQKDLSRAQAVAHTGSWRLNIQQNNLSWSDEAYNIFGIPKETLMTYESFLDCVHSDDRKYVNQKWREALRGKGYDIEHRIVVDGQIKWVRERAELEFDKDGDLLGGFGTVTDITGRKQMEEALHQAKDELEKRVAERTMELTQTVQTLAKTEKFLSAERKRFENVLEMMPAYAVLLTPDYHVAYANRFFEERFGEDKGRRCYEFLFNRTEPCEICETYTVLKTNKPHRWEWTGPDGRNYDIFDYPFTNVDGSPLIMEIGVDITEYKRAEKAVRTSEERYRSLMTATTQMVWTTNSAGEVVNDIPSWREFTGQSLEEVKGWGWADALHHDDREETTRIWSDSVKKRTLYEIEYRVRRHDGEYRNMIARGVPVLEEDGSIREWVGTCTDITEQKRAESRQSVTKSLLELYAREESRKDYLDSAVKVIRDWSRCEFVGIRIRDDEGNIPYESNVGFDDNFLVLESALHLDRDKCVCIRAILEKPRRGEKKFITEGGSFYINDSEAFLKGLAKNELKEYRGNCMKWGFKSISVVPIRYRGKVVGAIHLADFQKDKVTLPKIQFIETTIAPLIGEAVQRFNAEAELEEYRQHLEDEVKQRTEELARSNRDLEQFAYVASHDLQEPLRAVAGFVGLLRKQLSDSLDTKKLEYMNFATDGVARMQALISGLLEYSRVGSREKEREMTDSKDALGRAIAHLEGGIKEFGAKISIADGMPIIYVDDVQLAQVFQNLIGNAIKFCSKETPQVHISATREDSAWRFAVADNGIGIEPQYTERIFQIFQRLHSRDKYPGTGMGLALCKKIVERHGGKIWVESKPGAGSTFYFTIADREDI